MTKKCWLISDRNLDLEYMSLSNQNYNRGSKGAPCFNYRISTADPHFTQFTPGQQKRAELKGRICYLLYYFIVGINGLINVVY